MTVAFDQARHQHLVREALVEAVVAPAGQFLQRAGAEDAAVPHRHMGGVRPGRVHGDDPGRRINGGGHAAGSLRAGIAEAGQAAAVRIGRACS